MNTERLPFVLTCGLFHVVTMNEERITAKCQLCVGDNVGFISASPKATSNFLTHLKRKHPETLDQCSLTRKGAKRPFLLPCDSEESHLKTEAKTDDNNPSLSTAVANQESISNETCNLLVLDYIVEEARPLATVETPAFRKMLEGVSNGAFSPVCRQTLSKQISNRMEAYNSQLIDIFAESDFICTTADVWSEDDKSYIGVTAHIILDTLQRKYFVLACRRIRFSHTFKELRKSLSEIHASFQIAIEKISGTVTDNVTSFSKAFRVFCNNDSALQIEHQEHNVDVVDLHFSNIGVDDEDVDFDDVITLPPQFRCCSHALNLIATTDIQTTISSSKTVLRKIYYSVWPFLAKLTSIWNSVSRSTQSAEEIERICSKKLNVPCPSRWNSLFHSVSTILALKPHLDSVCDVLKVPKLKTTELDFLKEYVVVMKPLAIAIDTLHGDNQMFLGYVLPTVYQLIHNEKKIHNLKFCAELHDSIVRNVQKRFAHILDFNLSSSRPYVLATCSLPQFKLNWINAEKDPVNYMIVKQLFRDEVYNFFSDNQKNCPDSPPENNGVSFDFMDSFVDNLSGNASQIEFFGYFNSPNKKLLLLKEYPVILKIFRKYNVLLPSCAPVERIFSSGGHILTPMRNKLSDEQFEKLLFLKHNK